MVAILTLLAALVLAAGEITSSSDASGRYSGSSLVTAIDAGHTAATVDAYRRSGPARRPQPLPAAVVVVAALVVGGVRLRLRPNPEAVFPSMPRWHPAWESRGPPHLILV